ncbi:MAG TPA: hypothetical protein VN809_10050 [Telmatospirillum sp.]|nr:hypothetical protein [Telmatospirillum sp.]
MAGADALQVRVKGPETDVDQRDAYFVGLLKLALQKSASSPDDAVVVIGHQGNQKRAFRDLEQGVLDVVWGVMTTERYAKFALAAIPLEKGLLGLRVLLIRRQDADRFASVRTLDDLRKLTGIQGADWMSLDVMRANQLPLVTGHYDDLFKILQAGRVDYFPRGLNEAWAEIANQQFPDLVVEDKLLLRYPAASFFFTNKTNAALAARIESGLLKAINDGSFDDYFRNSPDNRAIFKGANLKGRRVIKLDNPFWPPDLKLDDPRFWFEMP